MQPDIRLYKQNRVASTIATFLCVLTAVPLFILAITADITTIYYVMALGAVAIILFLYEASANTNRKLKAMRHNAAEITRVYELPNPGVGEAWQMTKALTFKGDENGGTGLLRFPDNKTQPARFEYSGGVLRLINLAEDEEVKPKS